MADENPTLESLNNELQDLKSKFENRNVFQEIADQYYDLIEIKTSIIPTIGSMVNEGEEFILKVKFDFNDRLNKLFNIRCLDTSPFMNDFAINLGYWSNCVQKRDNSGEKIFFVKNSDGLLVSDYLLSFQQDGNSGRFSFGINNLILDPYSCPIEVEYHLVAVETINRDQALAEVEYNSGRSSSILMTMGLSKKVEISNEVIHPG